MLAAPSAPYMALLERLQTGDGWGAARAELFEIWRGGVALAAIEEAIGVMAAQGAEMWMRSGRVIASSYRRHGNPVAAHAALAEPAPVLHVYGQPRSDEYLSWQRAASAEHPWLTVSRLDAVHSHSSMLEAPDAVAGAIERFAAATAP
jgi:hypothetical protein